LSSSDVAACHAGLSGEHPIDKKAIGISKSHFLANAVFIRNVLTLSLRLIPSLPT
jgi:hypothetical protein